MPAPFMVVHGSPRNSAWPWPTLRRSSFRRDERLSMGFKR